MKAILVIDIPTKCYDCQLMTDNMYCKGFTHYYTKEGTHISRRCVEDYVLHGDKPSNCPLKPMPRKKSFSIVRQGEINVDIPIEFLEKIYNQGYNKCIDEILEGTIVNE